MNWIPLSSHSFLVFSVASIPPTARTASLITKTLKPARSASNAVARTQKSVAIPTTNSEATPRSLSRKAKSDSLGGFLGSDRKAEYASNPLSEPLRRALIAYSVSGFQSIAHLSNRDNFPIVTPLTQCAPNTLFYFRASRPHNLLQIRSEVTL